MYTLIQKPAPDFTADAVMPDGEFANITLSNFKNDKYVCLFFYPLDFTFVCPSEIISFSNHIKEFETRNTQILGFLSILSSAIMLGVKPQLIKAESAKFSSH